MVARGVEVTKGEILKVVDPQIRLLILVEDDEEIT